MIKRLRAEDDVALQWLMETYGNDIIRTAYMLLKDRHLAEDVSQEVFLTAYKKIDQFRGDGSLKGWLLQITINRSRGRMRLASWKRLFVRDMTMEIDEAAGCSDLVEYEHEYAQRPGSIRWAESVSLRASVEGLPLKYREVIILFYYQELLIKEISVVLGESEGTVKSKLLRARKLLRHQLEEGGWSDE